MERHVKTDLLRFQCNRVDGSTCAGINKLLEQHPVPEGQYSTWVDSINEVREKFPMWYPENNDVIIPQWAIQACCTFGSLMHSELCNFWL